MQFKIGKSGATFVKQDVFQNEKGNVRKYFPTIDDSSTLIREIYFSTLLPNVEKKWKQNNHQGQNITVAAGRVVVICINSTGEPYEYEEFLLDTDSCHGVLKIPPGIIYGLFTDSEGAVVVNALEDLYRSSAGEDIRLEFNLTPTLL
jgi:hypothetical protein